MQCNKIIFNINGNLRDLLSNKHKKNAVLFYDINRKASIKDAIESFGLPHTEIGKITVNYISVNFNYILKESDKVVDVFSHIIPFNPFSPTFLRNEITDDFRFIVDVNVGKLAGLLRLLGFDVYYDNAISDKKIAEISANEKRIVLTRDKGLLKRKIVVFGHFIRESDPYKQLSEILSFYNLEKYKKPLSRCMICNYLLEKIDKKLILNRLEPLTNRFYKEFMICAGCKKIYWEGSHVENMGKTLINKNKK